MARLVDISAVRSLKRRRGDADRFIQEQIRLLRPGKAMMISADEINIGTLKWKLSKLRAAGRITKNVRLAIRGDKAFMFLEKSE